MKTRYQSAGDLTTAPTFRQRFADCDEVQRKIPGEFQCFNRQSTLGEWTHSLVLWKKMNAGTLTGASLAAVKRDHAAKFEWFDKTNGRIPEGVI